MKVLIKILKSQCYFTSLIHLVEVGCDEEKLYLIDLPD